jgi:hypothetical protein
VVSLLIHHPELIPAVSEEGILEDFESPRLKRLAKDLGGLFQKKGRIELPEALEMFGEDLRERLAELIFHGEGPEGDPKKILRDCFRKIRENRLKGDKRELLRRIREVERGKGEEELEALLVERQKLAEKEKALHSVDSRES